MSLAAYLVGLLIFVVAGCEKQPAAPTTQAAAPATKPKPTTNYVDVVRAAYPAYPATQPLGVPVDYGDAGHFVIPDPVYLDPRGDLWITRSDGPPMPEALDKKTAVTLDVHIVPERVYMVSWATDEDGKPYPRVVHKNAAGEFEWLDGDDRHPTTAGRKYRWNDGLFMADGSLAVPTDRGVSVFAFSPQFSESYHEVLPAASPATAAASQPATNPPVIILDLTGLIAFSPWDGNRPGGRGAVRYADGKWTEFNASTGWPDRIVHLIPLLDGSVLQLYRETDTGPVKLALVPLTGGNVDETAIEKLVEQLSDDDPAKRNQAYAELTRYGPPSWPLLEKLKPDQPPEARMRLEEILSNKAEPTLGGRKPIDGIMRIVDRFDDSGILLYLPAGVSIPQEDKPSLKVSPAWISMRPGRAIDLLEPVLIKDAAPGKQHIYAFSDEWIVSDSTDGPRRLLGNHLEAMVGKNEVAWSHVVGTDRRGRWLFRKSRDAGDDSPTLIVDPTLPDVTPKLPVWIIYIPQGETGWSSDDYPAMKSGDAWALHENNWQALDPKKGEQFISELPNYASRVIMESIWPVHKLRPKEKPPAPGPAPAASQPTTRLATTTTAPTTNLAATQPASTTQEAEKPILVDRDGRKYYDGQRTLRVVDRDGKETPWTLPPKAAGESEVTLLRTADGRLFLLNEPGRVIRIKPTPGEAEPFVVEAIFTERIPTPEHLQRIWLDPGGRIIIAYEKHKLAILFPEGIIPPDIADLIPARQPDP